MTPQHVKIEFVDRDRMNLAGLMLGGLIERNLATDSGSAVARRLKGNMGVCAGRMKITLEFRGDKIRVHRGLVGKLRASAKGTLDGLLQTALGRGPIRSFLAGEISFSGNPFFLLSALPLLKVPAGQRGGRDGS